MEKPVEIDEQQFRMQQVEKVVSFLNRISAYEYVQRLLLRKEEKPSFEEFKEFVVRVNGIARDIPINDRKPDGETVYLSGFDEAFVPRQEDKESILADAYAVIEKIQFGDEAYLLPAVINAVHLFADGNGRTSRIFHTLLTKFDSRQDFEDSLRGVIGENGRSETEDISPAIVRTDIDKIILLRHGYSFENDTGWSPVFPEGFGLLFIGTEEVTSSPADQFMKLLRVDQLYCFIAAHEYLKEKGTLLDNISHVSGGVALSPLKMEKNLTDADWKAVMERYYLLKKEHVEIIIDAFVEPEEYKNLVGTMTLRDFFISEIKNKLARQNEERAK
ncbi:MAG: hypothetical protein WCW03_03305 [Candidatus Paceibacterota bacterium]|jgi:hypothetical protein